MAKTPEEIKQSVLKECERLCPNIGAQHWITDNVLVEMPSPDHWEFRGRGEPYGMCSIGSGAINTQWKVEMAYRLLNLEAREIEKRAQGLVDAVQKSIQYCEGDNGRGGATLIDGEFANEGDGTLYNDLLTALKQWKGVPNV